MPQRVISYGFVQLVGFCKGATIAGKRVVSLLDETLLLQRTPHVDVPPTPPHTHTGRRHNLEELQDTLYNHLLPYTLCYLRSCRPDQNYTVDFFCKYRWNVKTL